MNLRKIAGLLAAGGLMVGLLGAGVGAQFTDSATASQNISVGTMGITISAPGGVVSTDGHSVTVSCPDVVSSAAGFCKIPITVTSTGTIPVTVSIHTTIKPLAPFNDWQPGGAVGLGPLHQGETAEMDGGFWWNALDNSVLGKTYTETYTATATN